MNNQARQRNEPSSDRMEVLVDGTKNLPKHVRTLATLPETDIIVISCYLALDKGRLKECNAFDEHVRSLKKGLNKQAQRDFEEALNRIEAYLMAELLPEAKGIALS